MTAVAPCAQSTTIDRPRRLTGAALEQRLHVERAGLVPGGDRAERPGLRPPASPVARARPRSRLLRVAELEAVGPKSLMPLSGKGLWEALMTAPAAASDAATSSATAGVGRTPSRPTSPPALASPAASAPSSMGPLRRVSRPISHARRRRARSPRARPIASASSASGRGWRRRGRRRCRTASATAAPGARRTRRVYLFENCGRLRAPFEARLLALLDAGVPGEEALLLELGAQRLVGDGQGAGRCRGASAPAWPEIPPPWRIAVTSKRPSVPVATSGVRAWVTRTWAPEELVDGPPVAGDRARCPA